MKYAGLAALIGCASGALSAGVFASPLILYVLICTVFNIC